MPRGIYPRKRRKGARARKGIQVVDNVVAAVAVPVTTISTVMSDGLTSLAQAETVLGQIDFALFGALSGESKEELPTQESVGYQALRFAKAAGRLLKAAELIRKGVS